MRFFLSYRREDEQASRLAVRLYGALNQKGHSVFFDLESQTLGCDFEQKLVRAIDSSDVCLVLIGPRWVPSFRERQSSVDYVRRELLCGINRHRFPIVPILVDDTPLPTAQQIPAELAQLMKRDAFRFVSAEFRASLNSLLDSIPSLAIGMDDEGYAGQAFGSTLNYFNALTAPFRFDRWFQNLWWIWMLALVPVLDLVAFRGWRLDLARRVATGAGRIFPRWQDFGSFLLNGAVLWLMTIVYMLPVLVISVTYVFLKNVSLLNRIYQGFRALSSHDFNLAWTIAIEFLRAVAESGLFIVLFALVYLIIQGFLYRVAVIRFALTGQVFSFFDIPSNVRIVLRNLKRFIIVYVIDTLNMSLVALPLALLVSALLMSALGTGAITFVAAFMIHYWVSGYLYGQLGKCIIGDLRRIKGFCQPVVIRDVLEDCPSLPVAKRFKLARGSQALGDFIKSEITIGMSRGQFLATDWLWHEERKQWISLEMAGFMTEVDSASLD